MIVAPGDLAAAQWVAGAEGGEGGIDETVRQVFVAPLRNAQPSGLDHLARALADIVDEQSLRVEALRATTVCAASLWLNQRRESLPALPQRVWWLLLPVCVATLAIAAGWALPEAIARYRPL